MFGLHETLEILNSANPYKKHEIKFIIGFYDLINEQSAEFVENDMFHHQTSINGILMITLHNNQNLINYNDFDWCR